MFFNTLFRWFRRLIKALFSRTVIVGMAIILQIIWLWIALELLAEYNGVIRAVSIVFGFVLVLIILNKDEVAEYKLPWLVVAASFPVLGCILYLFFGNPQPSRRMKRRYKNLTARREAFTRQNEDVLERLKEENPVAYTQAQYLYESSKSPVYAGMDTKYFPMGEDMFPVMIEELKKAKKFIFIEYFIIEEGKFFNGILDVLKQKVKEGVEVRLMYDDMGCIGKVPMAYAKKLREYGINAQVFRPFLPFISTVHNNRDHRKITVIDNCVAFTGGINLADEYINEKIRFGTWKDTGVMLRGSCVTKFTVMFLSLWDWQAGKASDYSQYAACANENVSAYMGKNASVCTEETVPVFAAENASMPETNEDNSVPMPKANIEVLSISRAEEENNASMPEISEDNNVPMPKANAGENTPAFTEENAAVSASITQANQDENISVPANKGENIPVQANKGENIPVQANQDENISVQANQGENISVQANQGENISVQANQGENISVQANQKVQPGYLVGFGDGPRPFDMQQIGKNVYINILTAATDYVYITTPYIVCDNELLSALRLAARRGVDVRLVTPCVPDKKIIYLITRSNYASLIEAGVKIYEYTPGFIHAKNFLSDDQYAVVSTINLDYRSLVHHFECGVWMYNTPTVAKVKEDFIKTFAQSRQISAQEAKLNFFQNLVKSIVQILTPLL